MVLGVTGGIAAYKSVQVARDLTRLGAVVDVVLTPSATRFVPPLTFEGVTGRPALTELFSARGAALHIRLAQEADLVLVAPATADFMARAAHGRADDLLTTLLLATSAPVVLAPAMNDQMFRHPQTKRNLVHLEDALGYSIAGPGVGPLAYGEGEGPGRMLEPYELIQHVGRGLARDELFHQRTALITSGPTREPLDPVRYLGNRSSGRMGHAVAAAAWRRGAQVHLISGPTELPPPSGVDVTPVETAEEMKEAALERTEAADLLVFAAAVADFRPHRVEGSKVKRAASPEGLALHLVANPDVALETRSLRRSTAVTVGFALETGELRDEAMRKLRDKGFDLVVANRAQGADSGFQSDTNRVTFFSADGEAEERPVLPKDEVAEELLDRVADAARSRWSGCG